MDRTKPTLLALLCVVFIATMAYLITSLGEPTVSNGGESSGQSGSGAETSERSARDPDELPGESLLPGVDAGQNERILPGANMGLWLVGRLIVGEELAHSGGERLRIECHGDEVETRYGSVDGSGAFQVSLPPGTEEVSFALESDCLRLARPRDAKSRIDELPLPIELDVVAGASIEVKVHFPADHGVGGALPAGATAELVVDSLLGESRWPLGPSTLGTGSFQARGLPIAEFASVHIEVPGFVPDLRRNIRLIACETSRVDLNLQVGAEVSGRVVDPEGGPVEGARVLAQTIDPALMSREVVHSVEAVTDGGGYFRFSNLRPAATRIRVEHPGALPASEDLGPLGNGALVEGLELVLRPGGWIEGRVVDVAGATTQDIEVELRHGARRTRSKDSGQTDPEGRFRFESLGPGPWTVIARSGEDGALRVGVESGIEVGRGDLEVHLKGGASLAGFVVDDAGEPIDDFRAKATPIDSGRSADLGRDPRNERFRRSGGEFVLEGLHGGLWEITASARGYSAGHPSRVVIPSGTPVRIVLARQGSIEGRVQGPHGRAVEGAQVTATVEGARSPGARDETDAEGRYLLKRVDAGAHRIEATAPGWAISDPRIVDVAPGEARGNVDLVVGVGARLTGEVFGEASERGGRNILARPADEWLGPKTTSDPDGNFEFDGLAPGAWLVSFDYQQPSGSDDDWVEAYRARRDQRVILREGETTHVVLGGPRPDHVMFRGRVLEGGEPAPNMIAYAWQDPLGINHLAGIARSDAQGRFELSIPGSMDYRFTLGLDQLSQARFELEVGDSDQEHTFVMPTGGLRGRAIDGEGKSMSGISLMLVEASRQSGTLELGSLRRATTDGDGAFEFTALQPGTYVLRSGGFGVSAGSSGIAVEVLEGLVVERDTFTDGIELVVRPPGSVQGKVLSSAGQPLPGIALRVESKGGRDVFAWSPPRTDFAGGFVLNGIAPGTWSIVAVHHDGREVRAEVEVLAHGVSPLTLEFP